LQSFVPSTFHVQFFDAAVKRGFFFSSLSRNEARRLPPAIILPPRSLTACEEPTLTLATRRFPSCRTAKDMLLDISLVPSNLQNLFQVVLHTKNCGNKSTQINQECLKFFHNKENEPSCWLVTPTCPSRNFLFYFTNNESVQF
jgi:hypothetical protein